MDARRLLLFLVLLIILCSLLLLGRSYWSSSGGDPGSLPLREAEPGPSMALPAVEVSLPRQTVPAPAISAGQSEASIRIEVYSREEQTPIARARIEGLSEDLELADLGDTNEEGVLGLPVDAVAGFPYLVASASGFAPGRAHAPLQSSSGDAVRILLERSASITGRVLLPWGEAAGAGWTVLALERGTRPSKPLLLNGLRGAAVPAAATTDSTGSFVLEGLSPEQEYRVLAGGPGFRPWWRKAVEARGGDRGIEVTAWPLYGALLLLQEGGSGRPVQVPDLWSLSQTIWTRFPSEGGRLVARSDPLNLLAGLDPEWLQGSGWPDNALLSLVLAEVPPTQIGEIEVSCSLTGFEPAEFRVRPTLCSGEIETHILPLYRSGPPGGRVELRFHGYPSELARLGSSEPAADLVFWSKTPEGDPSLLRYTITPGDLVNGVVLRSLPYGEYEVRLEPRITRLQMHETLGILQVGASPVELELDVSRWGTVLLRAQGMSRPVAELSLPFDVLRLREDGTEIGLAGIRLERNPEMIWGWDPGMYVFRPDPSDLHQDLRLQVRAGAVTEVLWRLEDR